MPIRAWLKLPPHLSGRPSAPQPQLHGQIAARLDPPLIVNNSSPHGRAPMRTRLPTHP
jgi:hypothetical protein